MDAIMLDIWWYLVAFFSELKKCWNMYLVGYLFILFMLNIKKKNRTINLWFYYFFKYYGLNWTRTEMYDLGSGLVPIVHGLDNSIYEIFESVIDGSRFWNAQTDSSYSHSY